MPWYPLLTRSFSGPQLEVITLGHPVLDEYIAFAGVRLRLNSWLAVAFDLKVFFTVIRSRRRSPPPMCSRASGPNELPGWDRT